MTKFYVAFVVVSLTLALMIYSASTESAKAVMTVQELAETKSALSRIRLAARVTEDAVDYKTSPSFRLLFKVRDIKDPTGKTVPVLYHGIMPDTLAAGRDVILEGDFDGETFVADSLMTQCPSKYEAELPQESNV